MSTASASKKSINGILLLNKPEGITSNTALQKVKRLFNARKAGHTGSLDPLATGMLPICFGEATKISHYLLDADKCYQTTGILGITTDTGDSTGQIINNVEKFTITLKQLEDILECFKGKTQQVPSMFSALKYKGRPLYSYARQGKVVERKPRTILVSKLELNSFDTQQFSLTVECSKGTYIRNLVEDIGNALEVGAHVSRLHRVYTAGFANSTMYSLSELEEMTEQERLHCLIPMDRAVFYLDAVELTDEEILALRHGKIVQRYSPDKQRTQELRLYDVHKQFIGLGENLLDGSIKVKRLLSF